MPVQFRPQPQDSRADRLMHLLMGTLQVVLVGMILYLRFGPFRQVLQRMEDRGVEIPAWIPLTFNLGVVILGGFLLVRGGIALRRAFARRGGGDGRAGEP